MRCCSHAEDNEMQHVFACCALVIRPSRSWKLQSNAVSEQDCQIDSRLAPAWHPWKIVRRRGAKRISARQVSDPKKVCVYRRLCMLSESELKSGPRLASSEPEAVEVACFLAHHISPVESILQPWSDETPLGMSWRSLTKDAYCAEYIDL